MSFATLPSQLPPQRGARLQQFLDLGWPHRKLEAWRYTDLTALAQRDWLTPALPEHDHTQAVASRDHFALLNSALAVSDHAVNQLDERSQSHTQGDYRVAAGLHDTQVLRREGQIDGLRSHWQTVEVGRNATAHLFWVSDPHGSGHDLSRLSATVAEGATLQLVVVHLGRATTRLELDIHLQGPHSAAHLHVLSLPAGGAFDLPIKVHHEAPQAISRLTLRAIGLANTRSSINGHIKVYEGATKTDSEQHMASLLLSAKAEINAKPDLEIYNDDVKCAHGASFGQLDEDALFYLRARGLDDASARGLLTQAFAEQVLAQIGDEALREQLTTTLMQRLHEAQT